VVEKHTSGAGRLAAQCIKAIFFPIGVHATYDPGILKQAPVAGHAIGAHTWCHQDLSKTRGKCLNVRRSPERVLETHSSDKVAHFFADPRAAPERTVLPSPISGKAHSVPTYHNLGPNSVNVSVLKFAKEPVGRLIRQEWLFAGVQSHGFSIETHEPA
jgi:Polysaccharide deacetylase